MTFCAYVCLTRFASQSRRRRHFFTMTELMMVMVIIAVIMVMILPAVVQSKQKARYGRWVGQTQSMRGDDGLVILYDFEEGEGDTLTNKAVGSDVSDYLSTVLDGKRGGSTLAWSRGRWFTKGALLYPPTIALPPAGVEIQSNRFLYPNEGAISIWARQTVEHGTVVGGSQYLYGSMPLSAAPAEYGQVALYLEDGVVKARVGDGSISSGQTVDDSNWHHYVLTWKAEDTGSGSANLFFDTHSVGSSGFTAFEKFYAQSAVGAKMENNPEDPYFMPVVQNSWAGVIDEFAYWNRQLADDEIRTLYKGGLD